MIVSIASGKGGTGKTTLALMMAAVRRGVTVVDCDVEEPNCHLFLQPRWQTEQVVTVLIPQVDSEKCDSCGKCSEVCLFNALAVTGNQVLIFDELCHSCGGCLLACPNGAITEVDKEIGRITAGLATSVAPDGKAVSGCLKIGVPTSGPLIKAMKKGLPTSGDVIVDCPPGTSCAMVAAVTGSDYCLLVTEPTPFGVHDLELALNVVGLLKIPTGVVINKSDDGAGDLAIVDLCTPKGVEVLARIPHDRQFAAAYAEGIILPEYSAIAEKLWDRMTREGVAR